MFLVNKFPGEAAFQHTTPLFFLYCILIARLQPLQGHQTANYHHCGKIFKVLLCPSLHLDEHLSHVCKGPAPSYQHLSHHSNPVGAFEQDHDFLIRPNSLADDWILKIL